jgi:hypothetical protein
MIGFSSPLDYLLQRQISIELWPFLHFYTSKTSDTAPVLYRSCVGVCILRRFSFVRTFPQNRLGFGAVFVVIVSLRTTVEGPTKSEGFRSFDAVCLTEEEWDPKGARP